MPKVLHTTAEMRAWRNGVSHVSVGFVPTMGALHAGHADLLRRMRRECDQLVLSIFVNPAQFGPQEDLTKYPRTLESDMEAARECGVDAVFFPTPEQMYPPGYSTYVEEQALTPRLCGEFRPGHFRGVTTVVLKLFNLVRPHAAYFGLKDAQQFFVLHKRARDLDLGVSVEGVPTVREADGLALSSRNVYLSGQERAIAPAIYETLQGAARHIESGAPVPATLAESRARLELQGFKVQYLECLSLPDFQTPQPGPGPGPGKPLLIATAAYLGATRLIDNIILWPERLEELGIKIHR
jgi:pantoate--beta-alanine ligase